MLDVNEFAVTGRSACPDTRPVTLGANVFIDDGIISKAVYAVPALEPTNITPRAYLVPAVNV
jgi:hypothetical protein